MGDIGCIVDRLRLNLVAGTFPVSAIASRDWFDNILL